MTRRHWFAALLCAGVLTTALAGCTVAGDPTPATSVVASASATPAPPGTDATTAPTSGAVVPASCDTVLTEAGYADLARSNLSAREFTPQSWDYPLLHAMSADGVVCLWGGGGDVFVVLGQLPMDGATWEATRTQLVNEGYELRTDGPEEFLDGPDGADESYPSRGFVYREGMLYYTSYPDFMEFVAFL